MATETMTTMTLEQPVEGVLVATLNRPDRLNAMTNEMFDELEQLALANRFSDLRALIITGAGRAFCAGFDLDDADGLSSLSPMGMLTQQERAARALSGLRGLPMPVIAAVNGPATGGGLALALAADIRIGSTGGALQRRVRAHRPVRRRPRHVMAAAAADRARARGRVRLHGALHRGRGGRAHRPAQPRRRTRRSCSTRRSSWRGRSPPTRPAACSSPSARCRRTWRRARTPPRSSSRTAARRC